MNLRTLTVSEAARETRMPVSAIRKLLESGQLAGNKAGAKWRISEASLHAWINRTPTVPTRSNERAFPEVGQDRFDQ